MIPDSIKYYFSEVPAKKIKSLKSAPIIEKYIARYGYDASSCFHGIANIGLYECPQTGIRFYYPFEIAGPEALYRQLQTFDWNYKDNKWEHDVALDCVFGGARVLDVGCGQGSFLARSASQGAFTTGIEFNKDAGDVARSKGVEILPVLLSDHVNDRPEYYDVVTSFQVLEHVTNPFEFIECSIRVLKPGGKLIIGVPNDASFLGYDEDAMLNLPPHHMTLWTGSNLRALVNHFPITIDRIEFEPLQEKEWYQSVMERRYISNWFQRKIYFKLGFNRLFMKFIEENAHTIHGHTILGIFTKCDE